MSDPFGFLKYPRKSHSYRPVEERLKDWKEVETLPPNKALKRQANRCMNCGVPYCMSHHGCPLGNLIPEWNELYHSGQLFSAWKALEETNNFPEITGRLCPAPCESACVAGKEGDAVAIRAIEQSLADEARNNKWIQPQKPQQRLSSKIALIGSGPAGLAAAQQLNRLGHNITIFEKAPQPGGLLRYGIPTFKYEKLRLDERINQLIQEGVRFECGIEVGKDISFEQLMIEYSLIGLTVGAEEPRDLPLPGRNLKGIHLAMEYLVPTPEHQVNAQGKKVIVIGGGDTGSDCVGTALRQGAKSVLQLEVMPRPPKDRSPQTPWPQWPMKLRTSHAHEEGGQREWSVLTQEFLANDKDEVRALRVTDISSEGPHKGEISLISRELPTNLIILALGFLGPRFSSILNELPSLSIGTEKRFLTNPKYQTSIPQIFAAGDARRGPSLIVWAIHEGRMMAQAMHEHLNLISNQ